MYIYFQDQGASSAKVRIRIHIFFRARLRIRNSDPLPPKQQHFGKQLIHTTFFLLQKSGILSCFLRHSKKIEQSSLAFRSNNVREKCTVSPSSINYISYNGDIPTKGH